MDDLPLFLHLPMDDSHFGYKQKFLRKPFAPHHTGAFFLSLAFLGTLVNHHLSSSLVEHSSFIGGLAYQGKDINVFRFTIEYSSSLRDYGPY
jgi:hypothetical protein